MKKNLKKTLIVIMLILVLLSTVFLPNTYAEDLPKDADGAITTEEKQKEDSVWDKLGGAGMAFLDGLVGLLLWPLRIIMYALGTIARVITGGIAGIGADSFFEADRIFIGPADVIFNKINLIKIDFFNFDVPAPLSTIRLSVATWYYSIRNLAIAVSLAILIYVGIRMAISTVASEEAKYKKMLLDWLVGFALIFMLHYIIIFTININNGLVDIFAKAEATERATKMFDVVTDLQLTSLNPISFNKAMGASIVSLVLIRSINRIFNIIY